MPPPLYAKEAADVKTAKDCKDGHDVRAVSYSYNTINISEKSIHLSASFTQEQNILRRKNRDYNTMKRFIIPFKPGLI